jgi:uncharacterized protein (UPF0548 family)
MIRPSRPGNDAIATKLRATDLAFSYVEIGATADPTALDRLASHYAIDRNRFVVGHGRACFERARTALFAWRHFEIPWLELHGAREPVFLDQRVATLTRVFGLWFLNPCRVVYVETASAVPDRVAFAYGTLPGHVASGEERFAVRHDPASDLVELEILAFSRPAVLVAQIGYPWVRRIQKRFARDAAGALAGACDGTFRPD